MKFFQSFPHAFRGLFIATRSERNLRIHLIFVILVTTFAFYFSISLPDFFICLLLFALVISFEMINTCIEGICNILRDRYQLPYEGSKDIRDIAAGAVLFTAIIAAIIGLLIFLPYL